MVVVQWAILAACTIAKHVLCMWISADTKGPARTQVHATVQHK